MMELQLGYLGLTVVMLVVIAYIGLYAIQKTVLNEKQATRKKTVLIGGLFLWQVYIFVLAQSGLLDNFDLPPRFPLLLVFPTFIFTGVFLCKNRKKEWVKVVPTHWLGYLQSFRIVVETLFVFAVAKNVLNYHVTLEGYNFDMFVGLTAPIVTYLVYQRKVLSERIMLLWNYAGLAILATVVLLFTTCAYLPSFYGSDTMLLNPSVVKYPYVLVAGFLMPLAVFTHVLSIIKLRKSLNLPG